MCQSPYEAAEKHTVFQGTFTVGFLFLPTRVMQEYEIQVGSIRHFNAAQLAVAYDAEARSPFALRRRAHRHAVFLREVGPGYLQCVIGRFPL
jgi:hypothetical protein